MAMKPDSNSDRPVPTFRKWAEKHGTPWEVIFPKRGAVPRKRRFFPTAEEATKEIEGWAKDRKPDASLGKRLVDEVTYLRTLLPPGVTLTECVRFYSEQNPTSSKVTLGEVCDAIELQLKRSKNAQTYRETIEHSAKVMKEELGKDTPIVNLTKAALIRFIRGGASYWDCFNRKRITTQVCNTAVDMEVIRRSPLEGVKRIIGKEPKKEIHALSVEDTQAILDFVHTHYPQYLPAFVLSLFCGIRTEELAREDKDGKRGLKWSDIDWGKHIEIPVTVSKTGEPRTVRLWTEALTNWLTPYRFLDGKPRTDRICEACDLGKQKSVILAELDAEREEQKLAPVDFQKNDFRHSFVSYAVARQGVEKTMDDAGHGSFRMTKRYRSRRTEEQAVVYFSSKPSDQHGNVIALSA